MAVRRGYSEIEDAEFLSTLVIEQRQTIHQLISHIIQDRLPNQQWISEQYAFLQNIAYINIDKDISDKSWGEIISMMVPFFCHMCENSYIKKIGVCRHNKRVDILIADDSLASLRNVVDSYCDWQDANPEVPYFDINIVCDLEFQANQYKMTVEPKKSGVVDGKLSD